MPVSVIAKNMPDLVAITGATESFVERPVVKILDRKTVNAASQLDACIRELCGQHTNAHGVVTVLLACHVHDQVMQALHGARVSCRAVGEAMVFVITAHLDVWDRIIESGKAGDSWEVFEEIEASLR